jgi:hypothetical protein
MIKNLRSDTLICEFCKLRYNISTAFLSPEKFCSTRCEDGLPEPRLQAHPKANGFSQSFDKRQFRTSR